MTAASFIADAFRAAVFTVNLLVYPLGRSLTSTGIGGYRLFGRRSDAEASYKLFCIWPATMAVIPTCLLLTIFAAGKAEGFFVLLPLAVGFIALYVATFLAGLIAGVVDRAYGHAATAQAQEADVQQTAEWDSLPVPDNLYDILTSRIRGQDAALRELADAVTTSKQKYLSGKSFGMYLLVGATGSGKTETAKQLAFELKIPLHREECNQYATEYSITRLIGSAAGYKESETGGALTNALRSARHGVLLLDEIEKAHPSVSRTLMTLADEGFITTGLGEVIDARGWLILATSNAAQAEIVRIVEDPDVKSFERIAAVKKALADHWPAEIIARMRSVVPYKPVDADSMRQVFWDMILAAANDAGATDQNTIIIDDSALDLLAEAYRSLRQYGVREMRNFVERDLSMTFIKLLKGDELDIIVEAQGDKLVAYPDPNGARRRKKKPAPGLLERLGLKR